MDINQELRKRPVSAKYGAPMGACDVFDEDPDLKLYVQRIRFVDGDYSADGTYWGGGRDSLPLWCAFSAHLETCLWVRARNRVLAVDMVKLRLPSATFYKGA
jgi:hypothetical protein